MKKLFTFIVAAIGAAAAFYLAGVIPLMGRSLLAITLGMILRYTPIFNYIDQGGLIILRTQVLRFGIILLGFDLSLSVLSGVGLQSLPYILVYISLAYIFAMLFGRMMKINDKTSFLVGTGSAICGGSAILTVGPLIDIDDEEFTFAISTISVSNIVALVVFPLIGNLLNMTDSQFGIFAGVSIKDVASVVAVTTDYSAEAASIGTIVKLTRVLMLVLVVIGVTIHSARQQSKVHSETSGEAMSRKKQIQTVVKAIPGFVIVFIGVIMLVTFVSIPENIVDSAGELSAISLTLALVGIGMNTDFKSIIKNGLRPILLGELAWYAASAVILVVIMLFT